MSAHSLQADLQSAVHDLIRACYRYERCLNPAEREVLDAERKERRRLIRGITAQVRNLPDGYAAIDTERERMYQWVIDNGYNEVLEIYDPFA